MKWGGKEVRNKKRKEEEDEKVSASPLRLCGFLI